MDCFKEKLSGRNLIIFVCCVILGLLIMSFFSGKSCIDIESIAVSSDEKYIAYFETGNGYKIRCFNSDASIAFTYNIPSDVSAGGYCTLWFEEDILCALFYRTGKIIYFTSHGSILKVATETTEESHPKFPSFTHINHQYVYSGNRIDIVYYKGGFWEYWLLGSERYLAIKPKYGEVRIISSWTAKEGLTTRVRDSQ